MIRMMMTMRMMRMMMMIRMIRMMLTLTMAESTRRVLPTAGTGSQHKKSCCYREETLRDGDDDDDDVGVVDDGKIVLNCDPGGKTCNGS